MRVTRALNSSRLMRGSSSGGASVERPTPIQDPIAPPGAGRSGLGGAARRRAEWRGHALVAGGRLEQRGVLGTELVVVEIDGGFPRAVLPADGHVVLLADPEGAAAAIVAGMGELVADHVADGLAALRHDLRG